MSKPQNIQSFAELEERKKELDLEVKVSQRELAHSLGTSKVNLNDFLIKKVALPIGGAVVGLYLISKLRNRNNNVKTEYHEKTVVKEVSQDDPARYHYPVPPPKQENEARSPRYVAQPTPYQRQSRQAPPPAPKEKKALSKEDKKGLINLATVASVAKIAVPVVKMIIKSVKDHQEKQLEANTDGVPNV